MLLVHDPIFLEHDTGRHPETAERLRAIDAVLRERGLIERCTRIAGEPIHEAAVARIHAPGVWQSLERLAAAGGGMLDSDTVVSPRSFEVARLSAGGCVAAVDRVLKGEDKLALTLTRPPGHHATPGRSMGFCLFNNIALAADHARTAFGLERILIVDWDVHHGNGTQDAFYDDPTVTFVSLHRYGAGFYPGTGNDDETGTGRGLGTNVNVPLRANTATKTYLEKFRQTVETAADACRPQLILLSAGFDAHRDDPIGGLGLDVPEFVEMTRVVLELAKVHTGGKLVSCLEGGYNWSATAACVAAHLETLLEAG